MKKQKKSISVLAMILFFSITVVSLWEVRAAGSETDKPDQSKTLPANDGGPDGCNSSRFECVMGGEAVLDKQTGLTWARNTKIAAGPKPWQEAVEFCRNLEIGKQKGWRLPTREEWAGLLDLSMSGPCLPDGHPFGNVQHWPIICGKKVLAVKKQKGG